MKPGRLKIWLALIRGVAVFLLAGALAAQAATNLSTWASPGSSGRLLLQPDARGNRLMDYSFVGYKGGAVPLPNVVVKTNVVPGTGDDTARIQAAIDYVKSLPLDANGFRGAVLLSTGEFQIATSLTLNASGVVLRGMGDGTDANANTILRATGAGQRTLIRMAGSGSASLGTARSITNSYVPCGARSFNVSSTSGLSLGGRVYVHRPSTDNWITNLGMHLLEVPWLAGTKDLDFERSIVRIDGNLVTVDVPISTALEAQYGGGTIRPLTWTARLTNVGVESLRGVSDFDPLVLTNRGASANYYSDENHGWILAGVERVENGWARNVTSQYFGYSCVSISAGSRNITVRDCVSLDPVSIIDGGRRYAFVVDDSQFCLVQNCVTVKDRHQFVTQSLTCGPNVFVDGRSTNAYSDAGPHFLWGNGAVWDNVTVNGNNLNVQNRGNAGTQHGWAGANELIWNSKASGFVVQNPPTARNWLIGSVGTIQSGTMYVGPHDPGTYDAHGANVFPNSIYYAQLQDRLAASSTQVRDLWLGDIDQFSTTSPTGEVVYVEAPWRSAVLAAAGDAPVNGFDAVMPGQWVPFTFKFGPGTTERVVAASLALSLRKSTAITTNRWLWLDDLATPVNLASPDWKSLATGADSAVQVLDLGPHLEALADGKLNAAISGDAGIDWAMLEVRVAPLQTLVTNHLMPQGDAYVRAGSFVGSNFAASTTLEIKSDTSADNQRLGFLRWSLAGFSTKLQQARLRLTPLSVGTNALEHGLAMAGTDWSEETLTWSNQPPNKPRFATWIPAAGVPLEVVVTPQVQEVLNNQGQLSFLLYSLRNVGAPGLVAYASREHPDPAMRPQLLLVYSNALPHISAIPNQVVGMNTNTGPLSFSVGDPVFAATQLTVGAVSDNPGLVPVTGIALSGALSNRTVMVSPVAGQSGKAMLTLVVTNPAGMTAGSQFTVTVTNPAAGAVASGSWLADASGDWSNPAKWSGGIVANGAGMQAAFAIDTTAARYLNNDAARSIGSLFFQDAVPASPGSWWLTNQPLTLQIPGGTPQITVSNTIAVVGSSLAGTQGFTKSGNGSLFLTGGNSFSGTVTISSGPLNVGDGGGLGTLAEGTSIGNDPGARLELAGDIVLGEPLTVSCKASAAGNVPAVVNVEGTNTLAGTISLTTGGSFWTFEAASGELRVTGTVTNTTMSNVRTIWLRGGANGDWQSRLGDSAAGLGTAIRKDDTGLWRVSGQNTSSGNMVVSNGTLIVNGVFRGGAVTVAGGALGGAGTLHAPVTVNAGAVLAPGDSLGTLTISNNLTLAAGSMTCVDLNAQLLTCDAVIGLSNVTFGGTLVVSNTAGLLAGGQVFQLFSAVGLSGSFQSLSPASPGPNLAWEFHPANGSLRIIALAPPRIVDFGCSGGIFSMHGTGPAGQSYRILSSEDPALPLENWTLAGTGVFSGGQFSFTVPWGASSLRRFYRLLTP